MSNLPTKPSELIRLALDDLKKCEESPDYRIDMSDWHLPTRDGSTCLVCLAGSVMAQSLDADPLDDFTPCHFGANACKLEALDEFRSGRVAAGLRVMGIDTPSEVPMCCYVTSYDLEPSAFITVMQGMADALDEAGL